METETLKEIRANTRDRMLYKFFWVAALLLSVIVIALGIGNQYIHLNSTQKIVVSSAALGFIALSALFVIISPWLIRIGCQKRIYIRDKLHELSLWEKQRKKYFDQSVDILQQNPLLFSPIAELMASWNETEEQIKQALVKIPNEIGGLKKKRDLTIDRINEKYNRAYFTALKVGLEKKGLEILQNAESEIHEIWNLSSRRAESLKQDLENRLLEITEKKESLNKKAKELQKNMYNQCQKNIAWVDGECEKVKKKIKSAQLLV